MAGTFLPGRPTDSRSDRHGTFRITSGISAALQDREASRSPAGLSWRSHRENAGPTDRRGHVEQLQAVRAGPAHIDRSSGTALVQQWAAPVAAAVGARCSSSGAGPGRGWGPRQQTVSMSWLKRVVANGQVSRQAGASPWPGLACWLSSTVMGLTSLTDVFAEQGRPPHAQTGERARARGPDLTQHSGRPEGCTGQSSRVVANKRAGGRYGSLQSGQNEGSLQTRVVATRAPPCGTMNARSYHRMAAWVMAGLPTC